MFSSFIFGLTPFLNSRNLSLSFLFNQKGSGCLLKPQQKQLRVSMPSYGTFSFFYYKTKNPSLLQIFAVIFFTLRKMKHQNKRFI